MQEIYPFMRDTANKGDISSSGVEIPIWTIETLNGASHYILDNKDNAGVLDDGVHGGKYPSYGSISSVASTIYELMEEKNIKLTDLFDHELEKYVYWNTSQPGVHGSAISFSLDSKNILKLAFGFNDYDTTSFDVETDKFWKPELVEVINEAILSGRTNRGHSHRNGSGTFFLGNHPGPHTGGGGWGKGTGGWGGSGR